MRIKVEITQELIDRAEHGDPYTCLIGATVNGLLNQEYKAYATLDWEHTGAHIVVKDEPHYGLRKPLHNLKLPTELLTRADTFEGWESNLTQEECRAQVSPAFVTIDVPSKYLKEEVKIAASNKVVWRVR